MPVGDSDNRTSLWSYEAGQVGHRSHGMLESTKPLVVFDQGLGALLELDLTRE